jgi:hypothetical protein
MKRLLLTIAILMVGAPIKAAPPEAKRTSNACRANFKAWTVAKTESLTLAEINERMRAMYTCAEEAHHHCHSEKRLRAYLDEFYRVHSELAGRTFDFITKHGLETEFREEENSAKNPQSASNHKDGKP